MKRLEVGLAAAVLVGCGSPPMPSEPLGVLPSATTSAEPLWIPFTPRAGEMVEADARETHLSQLRRLTTGGEHRAPAFRPDGRAVVVVRDDGSGCGSLVEIDLAGGERSFETGGCAEQPSYVDQDQVVFARDCGDAAAGCAIAQSGARGVEVIVPGGARSPMMRGDDVIFFRVDEGAWALGGRGRRWGLVAGAMGGLAGGSDGTSLGWYGRADGEVSVFVAGAQGQSPRRVATRGGRAIDPAFLSPRHLLFASDLDAPRDAPEALELYWVDADGAARADGTPPSERITFHPGYDGEPAVSRAGDLVAFVSDRGANGRQVHLARWR